MFTNLSLAVSISVWKRKVLARLSVLSTFYVFYVKPNRGISLSFQPQANALLLGLPCSLLVFSASFCLWDWRPLLALILHEVGAPTALPCLWGHFMKDTVLPWHLHGLEVSYSPGWLECKDRRMGCVTEKLHLELSFSKHWAIWPLSREALSSVFNIKHASNAADCRGHSAKKSLLW